MRSGLALESGCQWGMVAGYLKTVLRSIFLLAAAGSISSRQFLVLQMRLRCCADILSARRSAYVTRVGEFKLKWAHCLVALHRAAFACDSIQAIYSTESSYAAHSTTNRNHMDLFPPIPSFSELLWPLLSCFWLFRPKMCGIRGPILS